MMMMNGRSGRYPFTASQWQELEHQALIFKYMASGHPIPSDLILPIKRSILLDTTSPAASLFPHQPNMGWGCFQMGFGRKVEDPEPGRCRRTDGKKWRCSKEAHPDSKYCERHMHRGKNRSRKPVETPLSNITTASTTNNAGNLNAAAGDNTSNHHQHHGSSYASSLYQTHYHHHHSMGNPDAAANHAYYPYSSYSRPPGVSLSAQNHPAQFHLDSGCSTSTDRDFRYFQGGREEADQYGCFPEAHGPERDGSWRFTPLGMSSLGEPKQRSFLQQDCYSPLSTDLSKEGNESGENHGHLKQQQQQQQQQQHCFVLGADFKLQTPVKEDAVAEEESQKPLRRFFDEWPLKSKESWIDLEEDRSNWSSSYSKTQLSISTPISHHDFVIANPHSRNDD